MTTPSKTVDVVVTRRFDAPVDKVWNAWVDPEYVKQWWGPTGFTCPLAEMDFREGGSSLPMRSGAFWMVRATRCRPRPSLLCW